MSRTDNAKLLADLAAWTEETRSFHGDRELADRVLLATGWRCLPDPEHPAKVRWARSPRLPRMPIRYYTDGAVKRT